MSQAIDDAIAALQAELNELKAKAQPLMDAIYALQKLNGPTLEKPRKARKSKAETPAKRGRPKKTGALGSTGGTFFFDLITSEKQGWQQIIDKATTQMGITDKALIKKLAGRATFAINALVKAGKIKDEGSGRERVFFV